jgi:CheY-like chemotaxis protein
MQGSMDVTSAEGKGTTFTVLLPAKAVIQAPKDAIPSENQQELSLDIIDQTLDQSSQEDAGDSLERILVIDDDPAARASLFRQLEKEGYQALEANNAKDGIKIANEQQPDLILLDLMMPTIDSWTTLSALKKSEQTRHIPVILQSTPKEKTSELDLDATELLPKPVDRQRMATALRHLNPQDRRGVALVIAPESEARDSLLEELADEAWQCITATSKKQADEYIQKKTVDIIFIGLEIENEVLTDVLSMLTTHQHKNNQPKPIYIVSEITLSKDQSRRLDLPADQIILFNNRKKNHSSSTL